MRVYSRIAVNTVSEFFAYRLNFVLWRFRVVLFFCINYYLWKSVYASSTVIAGYDRTRMLTYVFFYLLTQSIVFSTQTYKIADEINTGKLNTYLSQPLSFFFFNFARDIGDKAMNIIFSALEMIAIYILVAPPVYLQTDPVVLFQFSISLVVATLLYFNMNILLSFLGFWTNETWAPRFLFYTIVTFLAGAYFPLDIFPIWIVTLLQFLPFQYLMFFPIQVYMSHGVQLGVWMGLGIAVLWLMVFQLLVSLVWQKGLRRYTAQGG